MKNPIYLNTNTLSQFGFLASFNLDTLDLTIDWGASTEFKSGGVDEIQAVGFIVKDPAGAEIYNEEILQADIDPEESISIDLSNIFLFGNYTITGWIRDEDGRRYSVEITKNICQPDDWDKDHVRGYVDVNVNCIAPKVQISDSTKMAYLGKKPVNVDVIGVLYYPENVLSAINFEFTPFTFGSTDGLYTGTYIVRNKTLGYYDLGSQFTVIFPYKYSKEFKVDCSSGLSDILCCINEVQDLAITKCSTSKGINAKEQLQRAQPYMMIALLKEVSGKNSSGDVSKIKEILNCDCGCGSDSVAPRLISPSGTAINYNVVGGGALSFTPSTAGDTKTFTGMVKTVSVVKNDPDDLNFNISKVENGNSVQYQISFDYTALSRTILETILNDGELVDLFNEIVALASGINLDSIDGKCVVDLSSLSYSLSESFLQATTVKSILIGGDTYTAPGGLNLSNGSSVLAWLNGLSKGTFAVSVDNTNKKVLITSADNENMISSLTVTKGGVDLVRAFDRSSGDIESIFQAVIDYLCDMTTAQIKLDAEYALCVFDATGKSTTKTFAADTLLSTYMVEVNALLCTLVSRVTNVVIDCTSLKNAFKQSNKPIVDSDVIYGTKQGECARMSYIEVFTALLTAMKTDTTLRNLFCEAANSCILPFTPAPTNVSGYIDMGITCAPITELTASAS